MKISKSHSDANRRKYVRLDSVFPVQFRLHHTDGFITAWMPGFTHNLSSSGMLLEVSLPSVELKQLLRSAGLTVELKIKLPLNALRVSASAKIIWIGSGTNVYGGQSLGLVYEHVNKKAMRALMLRVWMKKVSAPVLLSIIGILAVAFFINGYITGRLIQNNKALVGQMVEILRESTSAKEKIKQINRQKQHCQLGIQALQVRISGLQAAQDKSEQLENMIDRLAKDKSLLESELIVLQDKESLVTEGLLRLSKKRSEIEKNNFERLYIWLKDQQYSRTGLVASFDASSVQQERRAMLYDQALVINAFVYLGDYSRAKKIINFFWRKARKSEGLFMNSYEIVRGRPLNRNVSLRANINLAMAVLQYAHHSKDVRCISLAEEIARVIMYKDVSRQQSLPVESALLFEMLYRSTQNKLYLQQRDLVISSALADKEAFLAQDAALAVFMAWGPQRIADLGIPAETILETIQARYAQDMPWPMLAPMAIACKIMAADFNEKRITSKALLYEDKADDYLLRLATAITISPARSQNSFIAFMDNVKDELWGSAGLTAYTICAYYNYNPLSLKE